MLFISIRVLFISSLNDNHISYYVVWASLYSYMFDLNVVKSVPVRIEAKASGAIWSDDKY